MRVARRACNAGGAVGVAAGCAAMVSMLPGAVAGALGVIGITGSGAFARTLSPIAEPLFVASAILLVVAALTCGRLVAALSVGGSLVLYLSMFQLAASDASPGRSSDSMSMMSMQQTHDATAASSFRADAPTFYLGLALIVCAFAVSVWRRRRHRCRPVVRLPRLVSH